jgi:hypothetical protein
MQSLVPGQPGPRQGALTDWCALTGGLAVNERIRERGGQKHAPDSGPAREDTGNALSGRQLQLGCSRKPLRTLAIKRATPGALALGVSRELVGRQTRDRSLISPLRTSFKRQQRADRLPHQSAAVNDQPERVADFHSLRKSFAMMLLRSGVDVRTAKDLMRPSTIAMTADVYAVSVRGSLGEAVASLPKSRAKQCAP